MLLPLEGPVGECCRGSYNATVSRLFVIVLGSSKYRCIADARRNGDRITTAAEHSAALGVSHRVFVAVCVSADESMPG